MLLILGKIISWSVDGGKKFPYYGGAVKSFLKLNWINDKKETSRKDESISGQSPQIIPKLPFNFKVIDWTAVWSGGLRPIFLYKKIPKSNSDIKGIENINLDFFQVLNTPCSIPPPRKQ